MGYAVTRKVNGVDGFRVALKEVLEAHKPALTHVEIEQIRWCCPWWSPGRSIDNIV